VYEVYNNWAAIYTRDLNLSTLTTKMRFVHVGRSKQNPVC